MLSETVVPSNTEGWTLVILGITTTIGVVVSAYFGYKAQMHAKEGAQQARIGAQQSTQTNDAVNHHHESGHDRLFDIVVDTRERVRAIDEWKERWDGLPEQLGSADALTTKFAVIEDRIVTTSETLHNRVNELDRSNVKQHEAIVNMLKDHIAEAEPKLTELQDELRAHVKWEETAKYPESQKEP